MFGKGLRLWGKGVGTGERTTKKSAKTAPWNTEKKRKGLKAESGRGLGNELIDVKNNKRDFGR